MAIRRHRLLYAILASVLALGLWHSLRPSKSVSRPEPETAGHSIHYNLDHVQDDVIAGASTIWTVPPSWSRVALQSDASSMDQMYPVSSLLSLPTGVRSVLPSVQATFRLEDPASTVLRQKRLANIKEAFVHSWNGYKDYAWLRDEVAPLTAGYRTTFSDWGATLVDSLDTLWIMGMKTEFEEAVNAAATIDFNRCEHLPINVFETTIRYLGGFLGAADISGGRYPVLLEKAVEVGEMLYKAFDTPNRMPVTRWSKLEGESAAGDALVAELGSLSLEFTRLSQMTGDMKFYDAIQRITDHLSDQQMRTKLPGLFPVTVNAKEADFTGNAVFTIGGMSDSLYEYFPKEYLLLGGLSDQYRTLYENAIDAIQKYILFRPMTPENDDILLSGTVTAWNPPKFELDPQMQHLACFSGGMFALGSKIFNRPKDLATARRLSNGCIWAAHCTSSGIMPELFHTVPCASDSVNSCIWDEDVWADDMIRRNSFDDQPGDRELPRKERVGLKQSRLRLPKGMSAMASRHYLLRPEAIESLFVLYRTTGDEQLRDEAWTMFESIVEHTETDIAFATLEDVTKVDSRKLDRMESFWLAETLKYFYLIFSEPTVVSLDEFVLNTEAHPLRRPP